MKAYKIVLHLSFIPATVMSCSKGDTTSLSTIVNPVSPSIGGATDFIVDGLKGDDAKDGKTVQTAWKTIQHAFDHAMPGSKVAIKGGIYYEELTLHVSGTADRPIIFTRFDEQEVIIDGSKNQGNTIMMLKDMSYVVFSNFTIQNMVKNNAQGIQVMATANGGAKHLVFKNILIKNIQWANSPLRTPGSNDNAQGFIAYGGGASQANAIADIVIDSCEFKNNIPGFSEVISLDGNIDGFIISNNKVHDNTNIGIQVAGHYNICPTPLLDQARNGVITKNTCYNNISSYSTSGAIYVDGGKDIRISQNLCYKNGYGIEVGNELEGTTSNITVINNILYYNEVAGIAIGGYDSKTTGEVINSTFRNNTLYENNIKADGSGEIIISKASRCTIANNIFYTNKQNTLFTMSAISPQTENRFNYNCWFTENGSPNNINVNWRNTTYLSFNDYRTKTGQDSNSLFSDPVFTNAVKTDFHLQAISPAIKSGNVSLIMDASETDFEGNPRLIRGLLDIGAYQNK